MFDKFVLIILEWFTKFLLAPFFVFFVSLPTTMFAGEEEAQELFDKFFGSWS